MNQGRSDDDFDDINTDEENVHDQLPSAEEYKAKMSDGNISGSTRDNPQDGEDEHDLPTVDEYKSNLSFRDQEEKPKSRAGLYTFLCLVLLLIIVTAIAVPLALRGKGKGNAPAKNTGGSGLTSSGPGAGSTIMTATPVFNPTRPPTRAPTVADLPRKDRAIAYLTNYGIVDRAILNDPNSPQAKATNWIAEEDVFEIEIPTFPNGNGGVPYSSTRFAERWALAVFYYATDGANWRYNLNFLEPIDHCDWFDRFVDPTGSIIRQGVTECQQFAPAFNGERVSKIEISNNNLNGSVPKEIEFFPYLQTWITPFNADMTTASSLDPFIALSESLSHLELQYCGISGSIPDGFGSMTLLTFLGLGNNFMEGLIPDSFFGLTNLVVLGLDDNFLESDISQFAKLFNMQKLYIEDNLITGQITDEIIQQGWQNMVDLDLSVNRLEGPIPAGIWSMNNLEVLDIHGNDFLGPIPEIDSVHDKLFFLSIQENNLEFRIPESIGNLVSLKHLDVSSNRLTIPFPSAMSQMTNLVSLYTGINNFDVHTMPDFLAGMINLRELSMKQNQLIGEIPTFLGGLTNLQVLDLDFNKLEGTIPAELGLLTNMDTLMLNRNYLIGTIPTTFADLTDIDVLLLDANNITGTADIICSNTDINTTAFSADCGGSFVPEISCSCCSICCYDGDAECNNLDWNINLDGIWEYDFQRVVYSFSQEILPTNAKEDYTNGGA